MKRVLKARCEKNKKKFNEAYWIPWKLEYESHHRYLNFAKKKLHPNQYKHFHVENQEQDWPAIDEYFYSLFRKLYNASLRGTS